MHDSKVTPPRYSALVNVGVRFAAAIIRAIGATPRFRAYFVRTSVRLRGYQLRFVFRTKIAGVVWRADAFPDLLVRHLLFEGAYQEDVLLALRHLLRPGDTFFDVGGHHGLMAVCGSRAVGDGGRVVTFEPNPFARQHLDSHLGLNDIRNVRVEDVAVSDAEGSTDFFIQKGTASWNSSLFAEFIRGGYGVEKVTVSTCTMDQYVRATSLQPRLIKIDAEGAEIRILRGARETIARHRPAIIMEFNPDAAKAAGTTIREMTEFLAQHSYRLVVLRPDRFGRYRFDRRDDFDEARHCHDDLANVLCLPPGVD